MKPRTNACSLLMSLTRAWLECSQDRSATADLGTLLHHWLPGVATLGGVRSNAPSGMLVPETGDAGSAAALMTHSCEGAEGGCRVSTADAKRQPTRLGVLLVTRPPRGWSSAADG